MQTRRNFLETLIGATALATAGPLVSSCASVPQEVKLEKVLDKPDIVLEKSPEKYDTIAHDFLDIENEVTFEHPFDNVTDEDYQKLDNIIYEAQKRITEIRLDKPFTEYTKEEAIDVLKTIDGIFNDMGFEYQMCFLFNPSLKNKTIDCDGFSVIYSGIAEVLNLPLKAVKAPEHVFVRWHFNDDDYFNWETTTAEERSNEHYIEKMNILRESIENGVFLKSLNRKESFSVVYCNRGTALHDLERYEEAVESYGVALRLHPKCSMSHNNKGIALCYLERYEEAIKSFDRALELNPNDYYARNNKKDALDIMKEK